MLRQARHADAPALAAIIGHWFETTPYLPRLHTPDEDCRFIAGLIAGQDVMISEDDGPIGFIARDDTEIGQLYIAAGARGRGIGTQLLNTMKTRAPELALWCFQQNTGARRFYENHGFSVDHMTDGRDNEERVPDVRYVWRQRR